MISEFITHLSTSILPTVEHAWTSNPIDDADPESTQLPVVMVYPGDASAAPSEYDNVVRQQLTQQVVCVVGCDIEDIETTLDALRAATLGWTTGTWDALELSSSEVMGINSGVIWVQDTYTTTRLIAEA